MAIFAAVEAKELNNQGIRGSKRIEWIKVTFAGAIANDTITYTFKTIKSVAGVIGMGISYSISGNTITFTIPYARAAGTEYIGLVEG